MKTDERLLDLCQHLLSIEASEIPARCMEDAHHVLLDTKSAVEYSIATVSTDEIRALVAAESDSSPAGVSFLLAFLAHRCDFDSIHYSTAGHPAAVIVPALLACQQLATNDDAELLASYCVGMQLMSFLSRVYRGTGATSGFHPTAMFGGPAAALACARFLGLDFARAVLAVNLVTVNLYVPTSGFGTLVKPVGVANVARAAFLAAQLAQASPTGDDVSHLGDELSRQLGTPVRSRIEAQLEWAQMAHSTYFKRTPCCGYFSPILDSLEQQSADLLELATAFADTQISVALPQYVLDHNLFDTPKNLDQARFSLSYAITGWFFEFFGGRSAWTSATFEEITSRPKPQFGFAASTKAHSASITIESAQRQAIHLQISYKVVDNEPALTAPGDKARMAGSLLADRLADANCDAEVANLSKLSDKVFRQLGVPLATVSRRR